MLLSFIGSLGSGKTLHMVRWAYHYSKVSGGSPIYSNFEIYDKHFAGHRKLNPDFRLKRIRELDDFLDMAERGGGILLLDEAYKHLDARTSMDKKNIYLSQFFMYLRKLGVTTFFSVQTQKMLDTRIREIINVVCVCNRNKDNFQTTVIDYQNMIPLKQENARYKDVEPYFALYDTNEFVSDFYFPAKKEEFDDFMNELEARMTNEKRPTEDNSDNSYEFGSPGKST